MTIQTAVLIETLVAPRCRSAVGVVQHLLHAGSRGRRDRGRSRRHARRPARRSRVRVEGRDARGVLVVHRAGAALARRRPEHDPRRRRRRDARSCTAASSSRRPARCPSPAPTTPRSTRSCSRCSRRVLKDDPQCWHNMAGELLGVTEETTTGVHRLYQMMESRHAAVPRHQRQRLGHEVEVRQPLRLPPLARRRHLPRDRRDARGQGRGRVRLRRRRQGLRAVAARPGRARDRHRDRPDLRAAGRDGGLRGHHARGRRRDRRHLRHRDRQPRHHHRRGHGADEAQRDRRQHRPLRQRDRHGRPREDQGHRSA